MPQLLDVDNFTGVVQTAEKIDNKLVIKHSQDTQELFDLNQRDLSNSSTNWRGDFHKVASIPWVLIEQWSHEIGDYILKKEHKGKLIAYINNSDFSKVRTKAGRI